RELKVYKSHDCTAGAELIERFVQLELSLVEAVRGQGVAADLDAHAKLSAAADAAATKPDVVAAFRARCASLLYLAEAFHKSRQKQEAFRPSWTPSPSSPS